ncbi:type I polyketide synthase [Haloactinomyces albus]|uniref:type I polyketide synthase n=1 Tax=Haloactinomyces albus TaxID=1352928 RepID=UPI004043392C
MRRVTAALQKERSRSEELRHRIDEPIAVVAMACRYPGGVRSPEGLWDLVVEGRDAVSAFPDRPMWNAEGLYDPDPDAVGTTYAREGGFVEDAGLFDPEFFGISPREAERLDPQQRLLLETSWEAIERGAITPDSLERNSTGVYVGIQHSDYAHQHLAKLDSLDGHIATGMLGSTASGRISYTLGLQGPAVSVDTACSSSLVALHLAMQGLRRGECDLAFAGGVTVMATPWAMVEFSRQKLTAPDGRCKPFSDAADGVGWSEGCGVLLLERLSDARANSREVLAVLRSSAVNQDGRSQGLTAPNGPAQERVIGAALAAGGLEPSEVDAVEAHGTGTSLGDPMEAHALLSTYGKAHSEQAPLYVGSIKSNIGHPQAAAGVAGVIKMVQALQHEELPRSLYADAPTSHVDWASGNVRLLDETVPWPHRHEHVRRAGVSSFGISGTNAHVIVEEASTPGGVETSRVEGAEADALSGAADECPVEPAVVENATPEVGAVRAIGAESEHLLSDSVLPILVSGRSESALRANAGRLAAYLAEDSGVSLVDVGLTLATRRKAFDCRASVMASSRDQAISGLRALERGARPPDVTVTAGEPSPGALGMLFTGQGSQRLGMGRGLATADPDFRADVQKIAAAFEEHLARPLLSVMWADESSEAAEYLTRTEYAQPALFTLEVALFHRLQRLGISPDVLVGHSIGELAAVHVSGGLSLPDAAMLVAARGRLMQQCRTDGAMASLQASEDEIRAVLPERVWLAAVNGPSQCVISGNADAVDQVATRFKQEGRKTRRLSVSHAFHSGHMDTALPELQQTAAKCRFSELEIPVISNITGQPLTTAELSSPNYWARHTRKTVRFQDGIDSAVAIGARTFVECGPDNTASTIATQCVPDQHPTTFIPTLHSRPGQSGEPAAFTTALGTLHTTGHQPDWHTFYEPTEASPTQLPTYAFQHEHYWLDTPVTDSGTGFGEGLGETCRWSLAGQRLVLPDGGCVHALRVGPGAQSYLADHRVFGRVVVPGAFHASILLAIAASRWPHRPVAVEDVQFVEALTFDSVDGSVPVQVHLIPEGDAPDATETFHATLASRQHDQWTTHARARLTPADEPGTTPALPPLPEALTREVAGRGMNEVLDELSALEIDWGSRWRWLRAFEGTDDARHGIFEAPRDIDAPGSPIPAGLLDNAFGVAMSLLDRLEQGTPQLPFLIERLVWTGNPAPIQSATSSGLRTQESMTRADDLVGRDAAGETVFHLHGFSAHRAPRERFLRQERQRDLFHVAFEPRSAEPSERQNGSSLVFVDTCEPDFAGLAGTSRMDTAPPAPPTLVVRWPRQEAAAEAVHATTKRALTWLQHWLDTDTLRDARVLWVTRNACTVGDGDRAASPAAAALWGIGRTLQAEHPDRSLVLLDVDETADDLLDRTLRTLPADESQLVLRAEELFVPRLIAVEDEDDSADSFPIDPDATVLVTGGTGGLGRMIAHHLVATHGVRHLLLLSRSGTEASGADDLVRELQAEGAETVMVRGCDVSVRVELDEALASVPDTRPLGAVVHAAGVVDDGLLGDLTPERTDAVLQAKVDAALHLHELTESMPLSAFVLFSSASGTFGSSAQGHYAAANAALDALALRRKALGLAATSLAWGPWAETGMAADMDEALQRRLRREWLRFIEPKTGLRLFDDALARPEATLTPVSLDRAGLTSATTVPAVLRTLVVELGARQGAVRPSASAPASGFAERFARTPESQRERIVLDAVREEVAAVLGLPHGSSVPDAQPVQDLGLDSLMAVEARNRLSALAGETLPASLLFDHPSPTALARYLIDHLATTTRPETSREIGDADSAASAPAATDEPIAIVSMACRYPGDVNSPEALWQLLTNGGDAITGFPDRPGWNTERLYDPDPEAPGRSMTGEGGFLHDAGLFDPEFFGISPREAERLDPQQRILLETCWEALERGRIPASRLEGSLTGAYIGVMYDDYFGRLGQDLANFDGHNSAAGGGSLLSGRIAYTLGLQGPAVSLDTACSSSLVTMHMAMQALRRGECELALAGGVTVMSTPNMFVEFSRQGGLAPDGRCKSFSRHADGVAWSEGCGILLLERLSDARKNGHDVLAVLRSGAINQDGRSQGLTAPNGPSQQRVIRAALAAGDLAPSDIDAVEAHGTGTTLGDPIEANALAATYGRARTDEALFALGSVKSNLGHTQAAAGVAGVIKMVSALQHEQLPRTLHADEPTEHVDWTAGHMLLLSEPMSWPRRSGHVRRAGVSSFGISGTNAHVIVEEAPEDGTGLDTVPSSRSRAGESASLAPVPFVVTGHSDEALRANAARLAAHIDTSQETAVALDVAASLVRTRDAFLHRAVVPVSGNEEAIEALRAVADGTLPSGAVRVTATSTQAIFVFPGQGSQYPGMCRALLDDPTFRAALAGCDDALRPHTGFSVLELLEADDESQREAMTRVTVVQPLLFAVAVALGRLWEHVGIEPAGVIGHSQGEVAAAVVAGALSLEDGARIVHVRSRLVDGLAGDSGMGSVGLPVEEIQRRLRDRGGALSVAVVNTAESTVVAGDREELEAFLAELEAEGVYCRRIAVDYASHSPQVDPILPAIRHELAAVSPRRARFPLYSTVLGRPLDGPELDADYWADNLRRPVRLDLALESVTSGAETAFVELSAHPLLVAPLRSAGHDAVVGSLHRDGDAAARFRRAVAETFAHGLTVDWGAVFDGTGARSVALPTYAFQRQHYWLRLAATGRGDAAAFGLDAGEHPFLGGRTDLPDGSVVFTGSIDVETHSWLTEHRVFDTTLVPGVAIVDMALHAARRVDLDGVVDTVLEAPLALEAGRPRRIQLAVGAPEDGGTRSYVLRSRGKGPTIEAAPDEPWVQHASGVLGPAEQQPDRLESWPPAGAEPVDVEALYERLEGRGLSYGPNFRGLRRLWKRDGVLFADVDLPDEVSAEADAFGMHPVLFDAALHAVAEPARDGGGVSLPFAWRDVRLHAVGATALRARIAPVTGADDGTSEVTLALFDPAGAPVASVGAVSGQPTSATGIRRSLRGQATHLYRMTAPQVLAEGFGGPIAFVDVDPREPDLDRVVEDTDTEAARPTLVARWDSVPNPGEEASADDIREAAHRGLAWLQHWLAAEVLAEARVVWITRRAVARDGDESADPGAATLWGLGRTFREEHPERLLVHLDVDEMPSDEALSALLGRLPDGETEFLLRDGELAMPRLAPVEPREPDVDDGDALVPALHPDGTVLVTGGTGGLARVTSRHLVTRHGARHLLLLSRSGPNSPGASALVEELEALGAEKVTAVSCDVSDRGQLEAALASIDKAHPLTAVVHTATVLDDGLLPDLTQARVDAVLRPKVDAAVHLHELTEGMDLRAFMLFSSMAGTLGGAAQANYAAANAAIDALAALRRHRGLPATSLAWGSWAEVGLVAVMDETFQRRIRRSGFVPLDPETGVALLDEALARHDAYLAPVRLDRAALQRAANTEQSAPAPMLRGLVRPPARRASAMAAERSRLLERLGPLPEAEREKAVLDAVRWELAAVLGLSEPASVAVDRPIQELGLDSLMAVELRNRLSGLVGERLPATLLFDRPVPRALAGYLTSLVGTPQAAPSPIAEAVELLERTPLAALDEDSAVERLLDLATRLRAQREGNQEAGRALDGVADEDLDDLLDQEIRKLE